MTDYFILGQNTEISAIGTYPQASFEPKHLNSNMLIYQDNWKSRVSNNTIFDLTLEPKAKLTRFVSDGALVGAGSICFDQEVRRILADFNIGAHISTKVNLHMKDDSLLEYQYMNLKDADFNYIDWVKSTFCETNSIGFYKADLEINSLEEYQNILQEVSGNKVRVSDLVLNTDIIGLDMFYISLPIMRIFVSSALKEALEDIGTLGRIFVISDHFCDVRGM